MNYACKVIRIIDGDTIESEIDLGFGLCLTKKIRLNNYDAPEIFKKNPKRQLGYEAKKFLEENYLDKEMELVVYKEAGKYGRIIGDLFDTDTLEYVTDVMKERGFTK